MTYCSNFKAQLMSSDVTFSRTRIWRSIRPASTRRRRELPSRQHMLFSSLAEGGDTPTKIKTVSMKNVQRGS